MSESWGILSLAKTMEKQRKLHGLEGQEERSLSWGWSPRYLPLPLSRLDDSQNSLK